MSVISVAVRHLIAAGVTGDALVTAIAEMEKELNPAKSTSAIRQQRYRDRNALRNVTDRYDSLQQKVAPLVPPSDGFPDPSLTPPYNPPTQKHTQSRARFDEWWMLYPHKVGKGDARKKYERVSLHASREELLDGIRRYIATKPPDREYCNPATWLNQERWKDEPAEILHANTSGTNGNHFEKPTKADRAMDATARGLQAYRASQSAGGSNNSG